MTRACSILVLLSLSIPMWSSNPTPWLELHSPHYTVITDAGERKGRDIALRFEQMRSVFGSLLTKERLNESRPLTILAFNDDKQYYQLAPLREGKPIAVPGFFLSAEDQDFVALNLTETDPWRAVARDFALRLLTFNYPPAQPWFDEGLLQYFSTILIDTRQVQIGGDPALLTVSDRSRQSDSFAKLLETQQWLPLPDLFSTKPDDTKSSKAPDDLYKAESWIVMHYLIHQKRLPETGAYFGLVLNQHVPVEDAIKQAYGISSAELEAAVKDYFHQQTSLVSPAGSSQNSNSASTETDRFPVPVAIDDSIITARPLSEPDARAIYAAVQLRVPERHDAGLKTLTDLANTPTEADLKADNKAKKRMGEDAEQLPSSAIGNPIAHRFLAWDHIQHGQFEEAFNELGDTASLNQRDMWVRYYLCIAKYRLAQARHSEMLGLANMMLDLKAVLDWNAELADAYDLLAVARSAGGSTTTAMDSERAAIGLSPRNETYLLHLAQIYVAAKKYPAAASLLGRLKEANDSQVATSARDLLAELNSDKKYGLAASTATAPQPKYQEQKSPFDVLEQDAQKRDAAQTGDSVGTADMRATKFVKGRLVAVDCSNAPVAVLTVHSESGTLKLRAADYKNLLLIGADDFSCDWKDLQVTANYKPRQTGDGDLVSLEVR